MKRHTRISWVFTLLLCLPLFIFSINPVPMGLPILAEDCISADENEAFTFLIAEQEVGKEISSNLSEFPIFSHRSCSLTAKPYRFSVMAACSQVASGIHHSGVPFFLDLKRILI